MFKLLHSHLMVLFVTGFVRFTKARSVAKAMEQFRVSEIVVDDVAIQLEPIIAS